jgi:hypothetical protein
METTNRYFRHGRIMFALPMAIGDKAVANKDLSPTKTTIKNITKVQSGDMIKGYRGVYTFPNGYAYVLELSTGTTTIYVGDEIA